MKLKRQSKFFVCFIVILGILVSVVSPVFYIFAETTEYQTPANMLYFKNTNNGPLMQRLDLVPGNTYNISFGISNNSPSFTVVGKDSSRNDITVSTKELSKNKIGDFTLYSYEVKIPSTLETQSGKTTARVFLGLSFATGKEGYVFDFAVEQSGDTTHTNILKNGLFETNLNDWAWGTDAWFTSTQTGKGKTEWTGTNVTLKIIAFDKTKFSSGGGDTYDKMLHIINNNTGPLISRFTATPDTEYSFSFGLSNSISKFSVVGLTNDERNSISIGAKEESHEEKENYTLYKYSFKIPSTFVVGQGKTSDFAFIGLSINANQNGYAFGFSLTKKGDTTALLANGNFKSGLDSFAWGWDAWFESWGVGTGKSQWSNGNVSLEVVDFDDKLFIKTEPQEEKDKMLYFKGKNDEAFMQRVALIPGEKYNLSFSLTNNVTEFSIIGLNDNRSSLQINAKEESKEDKGKYYNYKYSFTVPSTLSADAGNGKGLVFVGFAFPKGTEGYLFNISLNKDGETTQLISNGDFKSGLNNYAWGYAWFVNFPGQKGYGYSEYDGTEATLKVMDYDETKFTLEPPPEPKDMMLYFKGKNDEAFMQRVALIPGEKYNLSFSLTNNVTEFSIIGLNDNRSSLQINAKEESKEDKGKYYNYKYSFTVPSTLSADAGNGKGLVFVGFAFPKGTEGYLFNISLNKDGETTQLISNGDFKSGLNNYAWGYSWFVNFPGQKGYGYSEYDGTEATLTVMEYDESKFTLEPPPEPKDMMLYYKNVTQGPLTQRVTLVKGEKYYYSFYASKNAIGTKVVATTTEDSPRKSIAINSKLIETKEEGKHTYYKYEFTVPETFKCEEGKNSNFAFVGVSFISGYDGYFYDARLEKASDSEHKQILKNGDFKSGLDYWDWNYSWFINFPNQLGFGKSEYTTKDKDELKVVELNESVFSTAKPDIPISDHRMLYFKSSNSGPLMTRAKLTPGEDYYLTFGLTKTVDEFDVVGRTDGDRYSISIVESLEEKEETELYTIYKVSFTAPEENDVFKCSSGKDYTYGFIGFSFPAGSEGYLFDVKLTTQKDEETQLMENAGFTSGLDTWTWDWDVWFKYFDKSGKAVSSGQYVWDNEVTFLKVEDFDEDKIAELKVDNTKKMLYFRNGANPTLFAAWVTTAPGQSFIVSYSTFCTDEVRLSVATNGDRISVPANEQLLETTEHENYTSYKYKITVPETYNDTYIFVGVNIPYYAEGFIFDLSCYAEEDTMMRQRWGNPKFKAALDKWIWGWHAWFGMNGNWQPNGMTEWTNGIDEIKIMDFDSKKIDELIADINRDDGVWWTENDYTEDMFANNKTQNDGVQIATVRGTFLDEKKNPLKNVKMILRSTDHSYIAYTDKYGNFVFSDVEQGTYDLFFVNKNGDEISTGYFATIDGGDEVSINLVSDTSNLEVEEIIVDEPVETEDTASFNGTVYTPQLKTVSDLNIILRDVGEVTTDKDGKFEFSDIPVGEYELYTVLPNGKEYIFRTVSLQKNVKLSVKLKYDVESTAKESNKESKNTLIILISAISAGIVILGAGGTAFILISKKIRLSKKI